MIDSQTWFCRRYTSLVLFKSTCWSHHLLTNLPVLVWLSWLLSEPTVYNTVLPGDTMSCTRIFFSLLLANSHSRSHFPIPSGYIVRGIYFGCCVNVKSWEENTWERQFKFWNQSIINAFFIMMSKVVHTHQITDISWFVPCMATNPLVSVVNG